MEDAVERNRRQNRNIVIGIGALLVALLALGHFTQDEAPSSSPTVWSAEPDEPCRAEGNTAEAKAAAQNWCGGGVFTTVNFSADENTAVGNFQLSRKAYRVWPEMKAKVLAQFGPVATRVADRAGVNVAFSFHSPDGEMVAGCVRRRSDNETVCR